MHGEGFFHQAFMYLVAAVIAVPIAKRLGLGSVLGYLIAGIVIGPDVLQLVGKEGHDVMHFAEFGVVMMLFLVGLELEPSLLWKLRGPVLGLGGLQVTSVTLCVFAVGLMSGLSWQVALAVGLTLALSSTAIVLQTLNEKGLMKTRAGQSSFAVLLFQDIAVIPILALLPLLATYPVGHSDHHEATLLDGYPAWATAVLVLGMMTAIVVIGRFVSTPVFRFIAQARLPETFTAAALLIVIGIALLMTKVGLSPALGTFVAGVVLATSEYRHELEAEIEPFKGLLLGLFFIAVGASIDFQLVATAPLLILSIVLGLMVLKAIIHATLARSFGMGMDQNLIFSLALAQGGEFAFVLFSFGTQNGVIPGEVAQPLVASVAISMALTPLVMIANERLIQPYFGTREQEERDEDEVIADEMVIVAGYGRYGQIVERLLRSAGVKSTLLDFDSDQVELVRKFGNRVYYGDASRIDLLRSAGAENARVIVLALDNSEKILEMVHSIKKHFPKLVIMARAKGRGDAFELLDAGVDHVYRELLDSSLKMGTAVLQALGMRSYRAHRMARAFRRHDEMLMRETAAERHDTDNWIQTVRRKTADLEHILKQEYKLGDPDHDDAWETGDRRKDATSSQTPKA